jgi:hypothetical protein
VLSTPGRLAQSALIPFDSFGRLRRPLLAPGQTICRDHSMAFLLPGLPPHSREIATAFWDRLRPSGDDTMEPGAGKGREIPGTNRNTCFGAVSGRRGVTLYAWRGGQGARFRRQIVTHVLGQFPDANGVTVSVCGFSHFGATFPGTSLPDQTGRVRTFDSKECPYRSCGSGGQAWKAVVWAATRATPTNPLRA